MNTQTHTYTQNPVFLCLQPRVFCSKQDLLSVVVINFAADSRCSVGINSQNQLCYHSAITELPQCLTTSECKKLFLVNWISCMIRTSKIKKIGTFVLWHSVPIINYVSQIDKSWLPVVLTTTTQSWLNLCFSTCMVLIDFKSFKSLLFCKEMNNLAIPKQYKLTHSVYVLRGDCLWSIGSGEEDTHSGQCHIPPICYKHFGLLAVTRLLGNRLGGHRGCSCWCWCCSHKGLETTKGVMVTNFDFLFRF